MSTGRSKWEPQRWAEQGSEAPLALQTALRDAQTAAVDGVAVARLAERLGVGSAGAAGLAGIGVSSATGMASLAPTSAVVAYKLWACLSGVVAVAGIALVFLADAPAADPAATDRILNDTNDTVDRFDTESPVIANDLAPDLDVGASGMAPLLAPVDRADAQLAPAGLRRRASVRVQSSSHSSSLPTPVGPVDKSGKLDPQAELTILNGAQDALGRLPTRALALAEEHAAAYPRGVFAQEREVIAIEALLKLQRSTAAVARGRAFLSAFPTSTHAPRVQQMLGALD